ncbi:LacI family DNA-binding transcriptional regulator [Streptomyces canus]|uniref:LacI family DNA-binding transcriptional regulator n=1 Tax=Streptomyces canus TaxID=58343 RepID=UPI00131A6995
MTVSRVLNERPGVGDDTRVRVFAIAAELGYRPNRLAHALVTGRSQVLSVVSFDTAQYGSAATVFGVEQAARQAGYAVQITTLRSSDPLPARAVVEGLVSQAVAGLILARGAARLDRTGMAAPSRRPARGRTRRRHRAGGRPGDRTRTDDRSTPGHGAPACSRP